MEIANFFLSDSLSMEVMVSTRKFLSLKVSTAVCEIFSRSRILTFVGGFLSPEDSRGDEEEEGGVLSIANIMFF